MTSALRGAPRPLRSAHPRPTPHALGPRPITLPQRERRVRPPLFTAAPAAPASPAARSPARASPRSGKASLSAVGSVDARVTALGPHSTRWADSSRPSSLVSNVVRDEPRAAPSRSRDTAHLFTPHISRVYRCVPSGGDARRDAAGGRRQGGDGKRITLVRMEDSYATRAPARRPPSASKRPTSLMNGSSCAGERAAAVRGRRHAGARGARDGGERRRRDVGGRREPHGRCQPRPSVVDRQPGSDHVAAPAPATPAARPASASRARRVAPAAARRRRRRSGVRHAAPRAGGLRPAARRPRRRPRRRGRARRAEPAAMSIITQNCYRHLSSPCRASHRPASAAELRLLLLVQAAAALELLDAHRGRQLLRPRHAGLERHHRHHLTRRLRR